MRIIYLQSLLPRRSPRCKPAVCNFTRTIVVQHAQQTNVFVGNTLTDSQRESVFSGTTAPVGVILLPLPPITIAATYLRGSVFIRRRYICIFVCRKPCFLVFYSMRSGWSASFTCSILRTTRSFWRMARLTYSESISENCATRGETKSWSGE